MHDDDIVFTSSMHTMQGRESSKDDMEPGAAGYKCMLQPKIHHITIDGTSVSHLRFSGDKRIVRERD